MTTRRDIAMVLAFGLSSVAHMGCIHTDLQRNMPGHVDLTQPPVSPGSSWAEAPRDPGQRAIVVVANVEGGGGTGRFDGAAHGFGDVGVEVSVTPNTREQSRWGGIMGPRDPWRVNLGGMLMGADDRLIGESYAELQYTAFHDLTSASVAAGAAWEWGQLAAGPQVTVCGGAIPAVAVCIRGAYLAGDGAELGVRLVLFAGLAEWVWSR
jgi:hypothetical protein